ncbi:VPS10 domain-containing protein [Flavilitoribacter nigricans]|uniref:Glycosyl hydrolase n=1 Tax=Flavilitoribacter nigricans (strain ATCC 23147 / DSM 23189 / NBRC 102662 / NCIMB 1420 / SS-2) TaxID=1122177 RepID=A0A2D0MYU1_FLAN2|nr:glycosyl hydrolase [Flavilitoribacter nigricans]PHN00623.1 glycosyl hydrolase [Flavilitoribacter nigricans DSM 23189 = NBRC 102662]
MKLTIHLLLTGLCSIGLAVGMLPAQSEGAAEPDLSAVYQSMKWRNIGPDRGGRSLGISGSPGRPNEYYFGATGGGLWKTTDGGNEWFPVTDGQLTSSSVGAVAVAETNPDVVYIGMGEVQLRGSITQGDGVYKTTDGGKTWRHLGLKETQAISRIRVHPTDPNIVYVAALGHPYGDNEERGVFRSMDGGNTWEKVLYVSDKAGAVDLVIDRTNPKIIYATTWQVYRKAWKMWGGGPDCKLFKSVDGGDNWIDLTENPGMPEPPLGKIGITVSPADPDRLWAIVEANEGGVFRSDDGGWTWKRTNDERKLRQRAFYYSRIYADPWDKETVYGLNTSMYKSTDGGVTFDEVIRTPHGDNHDLWIDPNNPLRMANANDGGGNVSINGGKTWTEQDYCTTQLYHVMATSDVPYHVAGAQQDNSTVAVPSDGWGHRQARGPNHGWYYDVGGGESGWITQHPTNPDIFYAGSQGALLTRYDRSNGQIRDIQVYPRFFSGEPASSLPERWQWTFPIMFAPQDPNVMYTCSQHIWKTTDDGQSWERISPDLTYADPETLGKTGGVITMDMNGPEIYATVFALAPSFHDINTIWAGSDDGKVHITRNGGKNWQDITPADLPKYSRVSIIDESRHNPGTLYLAANRYQVDDREPYVFRTTDYGKTWTKIIDGIEPGHFARAVREDPVRPGLLFLGTEHGAYISFDAGDHWKPIQLNLPDTPIRDLVVKNDDVALGTHGRGFWILDDINPLREIQPESFDAAGVLFQPSDPIRGVYDLSVQYYLNEQPDSVQIEILDKAGAVIDTYVGKKATSKTDPNLPWWQRGGASKPTTAEGLNTFTWDLRYPGAKTFDGMIIWSARPARGPKAPLGEYQVRITAGDFQDTKSFELLMDPNLKGITAEDLQEQFDLAMQIRDKTSAANEAVIKIRKMRKQLSDRLQKASDDALETTSQPLLEKMAAIEEDLYQVKNQSNQDPLNFPIKLNNRLASLRRSMENGDARPTDAAYQVFKELSQELENHLKDLDQLLSAELPKINTALKSKGLKAID